MSPTPSRLIFSVSVERSRSVYTSYIVSASLFAALVAVTVADTDIIWGIVAPYILSALLFFYVFARIRSLSSLQAEAQQNNV